MPITLEEFTTLFDFDMLFAPTGKARDVPTPEALGPDAGHGKQDAMHRQEARGGR
ncbi:MAG: hypothetical protein U1F33_08455 [Alphaproteobacteria bacterium]